MKKLTALFFILVLLISCNQNPRLEDVKINTSQGLSLLNTPLIRPQVNPQQDSLKIANYLDALRSYNIDKGRDINIIWLGRRTAYLGDFKRAIEIYSEGITKFPEDARFYRHRGHRYISTRQLDKAIADLEKAVSLIKGTEDIVEPDGIPNRLNIPVTTLHTNIWYHLGLAYYLQDNMEKALAAFQECALASTNDDVLIATSHWLYMILRRMNSLEKAQAMLEPIQKNMPIIDNEVYYNLLLFYKGELKEEELIGNESLGSSEAVKYGIGNWYYYNGDVETARQIFKDLIKNGNWTGFGFIAAEADLSRME